MASGLDIGAAAIAISQISIQLLKLCKRSYRSFNGASKEVKRLQTATSTFSGILYFFSTTLKELSQRELAINEDRTATQLLHDLKTQAEEQVHSIKEALKRLTPLEDPKSSSVSRFRAKIIWMILDEQDLKELLARLEPMKLSITILQDTFSLNLQIATLDELRNSGRQINYEQKQEIKHLKNRIKLLKRECREAQREYQALRPVQVTSNDAASHDQTTQGEAFEALVERIDGFAEEQIYAFRTIIRDLTGSTGTSMTTTETGNESSEMPPQPDTKQVATLSDPVEEIAGERTTELPLRPETCKLESGPSSPGGVSLRSIRTAESVPSPKFDKARWEGNPRTHLGIRLIPREESPRRPATVPRTPLAPQEDIAPTNVSGVEHTGPPRPECMFVIHDDGTIITEEWRRPRVTASMVGNSDSRLSRHSSASELH